MATFVYTSRRMDKPKHAYTERQVSVWKLRGTREPKLIGTKTARGLDTVQIVSAILQQTKAIPAKHFANKTGTARPWDLVEHGIHIHCLESV